MTAKIGIFTGNIGLQRRRRRRLRLAQPKCVLEEPRGLPRR